MTYFQKRHTVRHVDFDRCLDFDRCSDLDARSLIHDAISVQPKVKEKNPIQNLPLDSDIYTNNFMNGGGGDAKTTQSLIIGPIYIVLPR